MTRFCGSKAKRLFEGNIGNNENVKSGAESHVPSGNTGQGVYLCGKLKEFNSVGVAKANSAAQAREMVLISQSHMGNTRKLTILAWSE